MFCWIAGVPLPRAASLGSVQTGWGSGPLLHVPRGRMQAPGRDDALAAALAGSVAHVSAPQRQHSNPPLVSAAPRPRAQSRATLSVAEGIGCTP